MELSAPTQYLMKIRKASKTKNLIKTGLKFRYQKKTLTFKNYRIINTVLKINFHSHEIQHVLIEISITVT